MRSLTAILTAALCATACRPSIPKAIAAAQKHLVLVDVAAEASEPIIDGATDIAMEACAGRETPQARKECMGRLGQPVAPIYRELGAAYDAAVDALEQLAHAYDELAPVLEEARRVRKGGRR